MNIDCERLQDQYSDYFEHILSPTQVDVFERHIASCASCRADYHTFATMFQFLDRAEVAEVDAPSGLRADILSVIAQRPKAKIFNVREWLIGLTSRPQLLWGSSLALAAVVVIAIVLSVSTTAQKPATTVQGGMGVGSTPQLASTQTTPLLQSVALKEGSDGYNYEVFTLHAPQNDPSGASVKAYVLQDGGPVTDAALENDSDSATPAWSGGIQPNVSVSLPVAVTSDLPAGSSLNLLLDSTSLDGTSSSREVAFVPITPAASSPTPVPAGSTFYDAVRTISGEYQQTIVADNSALVALSKIAPLSATTGNELTANAALQSALGPDGFTISFQPGGYYLISYQ